MISTQNMNFFNIFRQYPIFFHIYRVSYDYRIPTSGLSRGHPVDQVKMFKKNFCHFEKNIKVANICSKVPD
jgi:hypothetical protein